jgi:ATP-dependent RNA helicase RhlE
VASTSVVPEDYIHRVGRTARAELTGDAFTFVAPEEEGDLRQIERAIGKRLPRVTVPDFDYHARPEARFEVPIAERIAAIRAKKAEERARARANAERRAGGDAGRGRHGQGQASAGHARPNTAARPATPGHRPPSGPRPEGGRPGGPRRRSGGGPGGRPPRPR